MTQPSVNKLSVLQQWEKVQSLGILKPVKRCEEMEKRGLSLLRKKGAMGLLKLIVKLEPQGSRSAGSVLDAIRQLYPDGKVELLPDDESSFFKVKAV